jgi:fanconi-associated nuclease 1
MDAFVRRLPIADNDGSADGGKRPKAKVAERPSKRAKTQKLLSITRNQTESASGSEAESSDEKLSLCFCQNATPGFTALENQHAPSKDRQTDVEAVLPPTQDEEEAIHEYEAMKASASSSADFEGGKEPSSSPKWAKGRSSIYVDAFILALDAVLEDESHLFDDVEREIFQQWKQLDYGAQYL